MKNILLVAGFACWLLSCNNRSGSTGTADTVTINANTAPANSTSTSMPATGNGMGSATTGPDTLAKDSRPGTVVEAGTRPLKTGTAADTSRNR